MTETVLKNDTRRDMILERLKRDGAVSVMQLAAQLDTTPATIRRALNVLEKEGYLVRVQGGAVRKPRVAENTGTNRNDILMVKEKRAIAAEVAKRIQDGSTLFINCGTTMEIVAEALKDRKNLNIVTNALQVALALGKTATFRVILLGGVMNALYGFTHGNDAQEQLCHYQADWAIMTLDGISVGSGMTICHAEESSISRMMVSHAKHTLVAADHTKIGRAGFFQFRDEMSDVQLVTDSAADPEVLRELENCGVDVTCVRCEQR